MAARLPAAAVVGVATKAKYKVAVVPHHRAETQHLAAVETKAKYKVAVVPHRLAKTQHLAAVATKAKYKVVEVPHRLAKTPHLVVEVVATLLAAAPAVAGATQGLLLLQ